MLREQRESNTQRLIEREAALAKLNATFAACRTGAGRTLCLSSEAGVGKTTLLRVWAEQAKSQEGADVFWGGCEALFTPRPLGPVLDIAQSLSPAIATLVQQQAAPATLFAAFGSWLAVPTRALSSKSAQARVNVLIFEDVHWADHLTLDFLKYLARRIYQWPAMLVLSYRNEEAGGAHPLTQVLGDLPSAHTDKLLLHPLSLEAVVTLSGYPAERARELLSATGGNPFFVTEVLATEQLSTHEPGEEPNPSVPATVTLAVMARVQRVSHAARAVLEVASLVPGSIDPTQLSLLVPESTAAGIEECVQVGLLRWEKHHLAFRHELARRAVEAALSPLRRREMHARLYLHLQHQSHEWVDRAAYHAQHAHDSAAVLATAPVAAARAAAMGAHREAAAHYRVALDHAQQANDNERAGLLESWAYEVSLISSGHPQAIEARKQALELRRRLGQTEHVGLNQRSLSSLYRSQGEIAQSQVWLDASITTLESIAPNPGLAMAYSIRSSGYMLTNQTQLAQTWGERAIDMARRFNEHGTIAHALNNIGSALADNGELRGYELLQQSLDLALAHGLHAHASRAYWNASEASLRTRLLERAEAWILPGMEFAQAHDMDTHLLGLLGALVQLRWMQGRLEEGQELAQDALRTAQSQSAKSTAHVTMVTLAALIATLRDPQARTDALQAHWPGALASCEPDRVVPLALGLAEAAWLRGEVQTCADVVRSALKACAGLTQWDASELALWAHRAGQPWDALATVTWVEACALELQGNLPQAAQAWAQRGMPRQQAYVKMLMDPREHPEALAEAMALFDRCGAVACSEYARRLARKWSTEGIKGIKTGPRAAARTNRFGLTEREMQVAQHVAAGLSNQEIAQALSRSPRTVENHVASVLGKLGAKRRADVAALLET